jgi:TonB-linked SusC/RagA family outer membrane protein
VRLIGSTRGALTADDGRYRIVGVPVGTYQLRALRIGYEAGAQLVTVAADQTVTADFALAPSTVTIDEVVVTATGEQQRRRETGNAVSTIQPTQQELASTTNFSDELTARVPGVTVQPFSGTTGASARIRIRGSNSISLSNDPLIIVDGIRVDNNSGSGTIGVGGQVPSRWNDINNEDVENIEVIKGPAAAALYGTAAANGVIQITTKRGRSGRTVWEAHAEGGSVREVSNWPANYAAVQVQGADTVFGTPTTTGIGCTSDFVARRFCTPTGIAQYNPLAQSSPFYNGWREKYGVSASGGSEAATYYVGGDFEREQGVYAINHLQHINLRANVRGQLRPNLDVTVNAGYLQSRLRLPQNDNNIRGVVPGGLLGSAFKNNGTTAFGQPLNGFGFDSPADILAINTQQNVERFTGSINSNWQILPWLSAVGTAGLDFTNRIDQETVPTGDSLSTAAGFPTSGFSNDSIGKRTSNPFQIFEYTANAGLTASFQPREQLRSSTSVGVQSNVEIARGTEGYGEGLLVGTSSLGGATSAFAAVEVDSTNRTIGAYLQEQLAWRDRLFLTGAVRGDKNSAFGQNFKFITYPAASLSWVVGEEGFFPRQNWVTSLRLRTAYGVSGQRPHFRDAIAFYTPVSITRNNANEVGFTVGGIANASLKPERSREYEFGFDAGLLWQRVNTELTYYNKRTSDALVLRQLPLSNGQVESRFENLGSVANTGIEYLVNGTVLDMRPVNFSVVLNGSTTHNKLLDLGRDPTGRPIQPIVFGANSDQRHQSGYPLGAYFARPIVSYHPNSDGRITRVNCPGQPIVAGGPACGLTLGDSAAYLGSPFPTWSLSVTPTLTLWQRFEVRALFDHRGGQKLLNFTEYFRCASFGICRAANDPRAPLADQAAYVAALMGSDAGYIQDASFTKLRELSVTIRSLPGLSNRFGLRGVSLTLAGRNLKTWTKYKGVDPEVNENGGFNFETDDFLTQPQVRYFTARLDVTW